MIKWMCPLQTRFKLHCGFVNSQDTLVQYKKCASFLTQKDFPMPADAEVTILDLMNFHAGDESKINGSQVLLLSSRLQKSL